MVHNDRGSVLCGAVVTERIIPGALSIDHGAKIDMATLRKQLAYVEHSGHGRDCNHMTCIPTSPV